MSSPRIAIVGAGPGGLSLARLLTERGFADVTVYEREDRVGGKSLTWHHEGIPHEMGTCYLAAGYTTTRKWMEQAGMGEHRLKHHFIRTLDGELVDFKEFVLGSAGPVGAAAQITRYLRDWLEFHEWDLLGGPTDHVTASGRRMVDEVALPFGAWLARKNLDVVARFALRTMTIMGYGPLDEVPALYGLRWNVPSLLWSAVTLKVTEPIPGWQYLWRFLAGQLDVRRNHTITRVERVGDGFRVEVDGQRPQTYDHLVLSGALDEAAKFFPFSEEEKVDFAVGHDRLRWHSYVTSLVHANGWFTDADTRSFQGHAQDAAATAQGRILVARRTGDKIPVARARTHRDPAEGRPNVYVCYQYGAGHSPEQQQAILRDDLAREGVTEAEILKHCPWKYAPQLTYGAIAGGAVERMERRQGVGNLWITGATASHEAVDNIVDYNERLADRMALAFVGRDPSTPEALAEIAGKYRYRIHDK